MNKKKKNALIALIVILVVVILAIGGVAIYKYFFAEKPQYAGGVAGVISDGWDDGLKDEQKPDSEGIRIPGYSTAQMTEGNTSLHLSIGNPSENSCGFYATLMLTDGTILYKSELLEPGYGLTDVPLSQTLDSGEYDAAIYYECVTLDDTHSPLNAAESEFKLIVMERK